VKDFAAGGNFNYIYFDKPYEYPDKFDISEIYHPAKTDFTYDDNEPGLEFSSGLIGSEKINFVLCI